MDGANLIWTKMSEDATLSAASDPALPVLRTKIDDFEAAHALTKTEKNAVPAREAQRESLWSSLGSELGAVQRLCDAAPGDAGTIAASAGMRLKARRRDTVELLTAQLTTTKGTVALRASLALLIAMLPPGRGQGGKRTILWRYTVNNGASYVDVESTPFVTREVAGLPLGVDVGFEVALRDRRGTSAWSQTYILHVY